MFVGVFLNPSTAVGDFGSVDFVANEFPFVFSFGAAGNDALDFERFLVFVVTPFFRIFV